VSIPLEERVAVNRFLRLVEKERLKSRLTILRHLEGCSNSGRCSASIDFTSHIMTTDYIQFFMLKFCFKSKLKIEGKNCFNIQVIMA
jgi:hypothetical protein